MKSTKASRQTLLEMTTHILNLLEHLYGTDEALGKVQNLTPGDLRSLWTRVVMSHSYEDPNPSVCYRIDGSRLFRHDRNFETYPDNMTDATLQTALKRVHALMKKAALKRWGNPRIMKAMVYDVTLSILDAGEISESKTRVGVVIGEWESWMLDTTLDNSVYFWFDDPEDIIVGAALDGDTTIKAIHGSPYVETARETI